MSEFGQRNKIVAGLVFFVTTIIYLSTLAPTVAFWDCGEFITTAYTLGIPHPPGAPFYTLLGRIFSMLPFGEIAFRVNLLSAAAGIATVFFYLFVYCPFALHMARPREYRPTNRHFGRWCGCFPQHGIFFFFLE